MTPRTPLIALPGVRTLPAWIRRHLGGRGKRPRQQTPQRRRTFHRHFRDAQGRSARFHVYARHIDPHRPVGVVFFLDGDYWLPGQSRFHRPRGLTMLRMAAVANARNLVFVVPDTPDRSLSKEGRTWWVRTEHNGAWFRAFAGHVVHRLGIEPRLAWVMGYSGGAEFLTFDLLARDQPPWWGGGAVLVGGGGAPEGVLEAPASCRDLPTSWWVGEQDGDPEGDGMTWSARHAADQGHAAFRAAGFRATARHLLPQTEHWQYDLPGILRSCLDRAGLLPLHRRRATGRPPRDAAPARPWHRPIATA